jgi:uncharacterized protein (TIGR03067 family)
MHTNVSVHVSPARPTTGKIALWTGGARRGVWAAGMALCLVGLAASAELYKSTDANGRIQYSDRPPPGRMPTAIAGNAAVPELRGRWRVANTTMNGELRYDAKFAGGTWTFDGDKLLVETAGGERTRFTVAAEPGPRPQALRLTPVPPSRERGGSMIYERDQDRLRVAFMDNFEGRPTGFAPQPKLLVTTLIALDRAGNSRAATTVAGGDACAMLRAAGVDQALGFAVTLLVVRAATRATFDRERDKRAADARYVVLDEPALGTAAFSSTRGNRMLVVTLKGDTLLEMAFDLPPAYRDRIVQFVRRVLAAG